MTHLCQRGQGSLHIGTAVPQGVDVTQRLILSIAGPLLLRPASCLLNLQDLYMHS